MFRKRNPLHYVYILGIGILALIFIYFIILLLPYLKTFAKVLWKIFMPFVLSAIIAYLLEPIIRRMTWWRMHKGVAILTIYVLFFGGIGLFLYKVYPQIINQLTEFSNQLPELVRTYQDLVYQLYVSTSFLPESVHDQMDRFFLKIEGTIESSLFQWDGDIMRLFDVILLLTIIPVLVFYYLKDYALMKDFTKKCIPGKYHRKLSIFIDAIDESLGNYIRGQMIVSLFVGLVSWLAFYLLKIDYALLLGIIMAITNLIPYFGPIIGAVPAVAIALMDSTSLVIYVLIVVLAVQLIEGNFLSPFIVGRSIQIHPIAILFVLLIGSELWGIVGMIVAVPLLTIVNTSFIRFRELKKGSSISKNF